MDFGGLKTFKAWLEDMFDHTVVIAEDDPQRKKLVKSLKKVADVRVVENVGAEKFAELAYRQMASILEVNKSLGVSLNPTVRVKSVECFEHAANSAIYEEVKEESLF